MPFDAVAAEIATPATIAAAGWMTVKVADASRPAVTNATRLTHVLATVLATVLVTALAPVLVTALVTVHFMVPPPPAPARHPQRPRQVPTTSNIAHDRRRA
ncbi:hypothetical protein GCM10009630_52930 [Kribbella jejuensis]